MAGWSRPASLVLLLTWAGLAWSQVPGEPKHLAAARDLLAHLDLKNTNYEHGAGNVTFSGTRESHTDCSGFVDALLRHCYSYDESAFKQWFGSRRPTAARYHDAIEAETGFTRVRYVRDLRPGDLLAVKYLMNKENTGHVMLASGLPRRMEAKKPFVDGTEQWEVAVIDSSQSGHGTQDTRHKKGHDGKDHDGLGEGRLRLYTEREGGVVGFTWSTLNASAFKEPKDEHLVMGRLKPEYQP